MTDTRIQTDDELVKRIARVSENARATWFGLLAFLAFVGVTLLAHNDAQFYARDVQTALPLIGISVPVEGFFVTGPMLVAAVYAYLHLYLIGLWKPLAEVGPAPGGLPLSEQIYPWLLTRAMLAFRRDGAGGPYAMATVTLAVSILITWVWGPLTLGWFLWESFPRHSAGLSLWIAALFCFAGYVGIRSFATMLRLMRGAGDGPEVHRVPESLTRWGFWPGWAAVILAVSLQLSVGIPHLIGHWTGTEPVDPWDRWFARFERDWRAENAVPPEADLFQGALAGRFWRAVRVARPYSFGYGGFAVMVAADITEARLIDRPAGWQSFDDWRRGFDKRTSEAPDAGENPRGYWQAVRRAWRIHLGDVDGPVLKGVDLRRARMENAFLPKADLRGADLAGALARRVRVQGALLGPLNPDDTESPGADLRGADLRGAELQGADLRRADLRGADLTNANLQGTNLREAKLQGANIRSAQLQGADLFGAALEGADLSFAQLQGANLVRAQLQGANLNPAQMQGADLFGAALEGADLVGAQLQGANLVRAQLQGANLVRAQLQGANLVSAQLQGAVLVEAQLQGADLEGAQLQGARCTGARVAGALLQEANIACRPDGRMDVTGAIGDERTTVLPGQQIASCWVEPPATLEATLATLEATLEATLARIPEGWRDRFLDQWMCGDRRPRPTGRWVIACPQMSDEFGDYRERLASHDPTAIDGACYRPVSEKALASWRAPEPPFARRRVAD